MDDKRLKLAKEALESGSYDKETIEYIFPELAESEDEKIRKDLIRWVNTNISYERMPDGMNYSNECVLAWLEKQGEQKPSWSEEDEIGYNDALFAIEKARLVAKDENDMGNLWFAENWLKSLKRSRVVKIEKQDERKSKDNSASELKESKDDERLRKTTIGFLKDFAKQGYEKAVECIDWLEKQGEQKRLGYPYVTGWRENRPDNKPQIKHSVLMLTTHGVVEGEWLGDGWYQYRWTCKVKDTDVLYWLHLSDLESLEKEGYNNSISSEEIGKSIIRGIAGSLTNYLDNNRYAGAMNMSNMECEDLEKAILGSDWEKVYRYMQKKLEKQGGQKSYWSEDDEEMKRTIISNLFILKGMYTHPDKQIDYNNMIEWLKSLKPQSHWKPTQEQMTALKIVKNGFPSDDLDAIESLYNDLKKL